MLNVKTSFVLKEYILAKFGLHAHFLQDNFSTKLIVKLNATQGKVHFELVYVFLKVLAEQFITVAKSKVSAYHLNKALGEP